MHTYRSSFGHRFPLWLLGLPVIFAPLLFAGCQGEAISVYEAPKSEPVVAARVRYRLLTIVIPNEKRMWVIKLLAPDKQVEPYVGEFDQFASTIRFTKEQGKPIEWKLPEGWIPGPPREFGFASFKVRGDEDAPEVTISRLDDKKEFDLDNINRWRGQISLGRVKEEQLGELKKEIKIGDVVAYRLDMTGMPMFPIPKRAAAPMFPDKADKPVKYKTPEGWKEQPLKQLSVATFLVEQGNDKAEVTITPLSGKSGTVLENVNRWRKQVGLSMINEETLAKEAKTIKIDGVDAVYVNAMGNDVAILGYIMPRGQTTWFIKMTGPKDLVAKQEAAFKEFGRTLEF